MTDEEKVETEENEQDQPAGNQPGPGGALSEVEKTTMDRVGAIFSKACQAVLSTLTGSEAEVTAAEIGLLDLDQEKSRHAGPALLAKLPCEQGDLGDILVLLKEESAPRIAGLMESGRGEEGVMEDVGAFLAQVAEAAVAELAASFGGAVVFGQAQVQQVDFAETQSELAGRMSARLGLKINGDGTDELVVLAARQAAEKCTAGAGSGADGVVVEPAQFTPFGAQGGPGGEASSLDMVMDLSLPVSVELGRVKMVIGDILKLRRGSIVELEKSAGEPVDLFVNDRKFGEGEVVVVHENYGVRIISLVDGVDRNSGQS